MLRKLRRLRILLLLAMVGMMIFLPARTEAKRDYVVITAKGKKYHEPDCRTVKKVFRKLTVEQAKSLGFKRCKICNPD